MHVRSNGGFSMVEMLVTTAILTSATYLIMGTMNDLMAGLKRTETSATFQMLRSNFSSMILDRVAWNNTIYMNPGFSCWKKQAGCAGAGNIAFVPYTPDSKLYLNYDPVSNPKQGFQMDGRTCSSFDKKTPDPLCPLQIQFVAVPKCAFNNCFRPQFEVSMKFDFALVNEGKQASLFSKGGLDRVMLTYSDAIPLQLTSATNPTVCPPDAKGFPQLIVGFDQYTGAIQCATGKTRIHH
jgi:prepilin-type N-terminal cleavage/methylation domain-containing protein